MYTYVYIYRHADGGNLPVTDGLTAPAEFVRQLSVSLARQYDVNGFTPDILYVGATGGVRSALANGSITDEVVASFRDALVSAFRGSIQVVKFEVLTGKQEAVWELEAAQAIWGGRASDMFPSRSEGTLIIKEDMSCAPTQTNICGCLAGGNQQQIGLFSGGGQSMQLGQCGCEPLSFPFSTFPKSMEERQGASLDAWLDDSIWRHFEEDLLTKVKEKAAHIIGLMAALLAPP